MKIKKEKTNYVYNFDDSLFEFSENTIYHMRKICYDYTRFIDLEENFSCNNRTDIYDESEDMRNRFGNFEAVILNLGEKIKNLIEKYGNSVNYCEVPRSLETDIRLKEHSAYIPELEKKS